MRLEEPDPTTGLYFAAFGPALRLRQVIVGACSEVSRSMLAEALGAFGDDVRTLKARLAFKSFKVVRQRSAALWT